MGIGIKDVSGSLGSFVLLSPEVQYRFSRRDAKLGISYYAPTAGAKYIYLNPNLITKVTVNVGIYNNGKSDLDIHLFEFTEANGRSSTYAIDDRGLELLGVKNPNEGEVNPRDFA
jgi:hypothetical protein